GGPGDAGERRGQGVGQDTAGRGQGRPVHAGGGGVRHTTGVQPLGIRDGAAERHGVAVVLRRRGHVLDRPEGLQRGDAWQTDATERQGEEDRGGEEKGVTDYKNLTNPKRQRGPSLADASSLFADSMTSQGPQSRLPIRATHFVARWLAPAVLAPEGERHNL